MRTAARLLVAAALAASAHAQTPLTTVRVASGLDAPVYVTHEPGRAGRLYVVQQRGKVVVVEDGQVLATPFLDLGAKVSQGFSERGLLGFAFHPDYAANGHVYVCYTDEPFGQTYLERYTRSASDPAVVDPASGLLLLGPIPQPFPNHQGGCLQFGPDGMLYLATGDGGGSGDPACFAQDGASLHGKLLRLAPDGSIPPSNPFVGDPSHRDEIWAKGLRNPWRFSFDRATGDLYLGDVGQNAREEIDFQPASNGGGENYGWKIAEGTTCFGTASCAPGVPACGHPSLTPPIRDFPSYDGGGCAVIGGYVYRGCAIPSLHGTYFYGDYCSGRIFSFRYDGTTLTDLADRTAELAPGGVFSIDLISSFGEDADGELYVVDVGGEIFRIVPAAGSPFAALGSETPGTGGVAPVLEGCGPLSSGTTSLVRLREAAPSAPAVALLALATSPFPFFGGTVLPDPVSGTVVLFTTDASGAFEVALAGGAGPVDAFLQCGVVDPGALGGIALSNALRMTFAP